MILNMNGGGSGGVPSDGGSIIKMKVGSTGVTEGQLLSMNYNLGLSASPTQVNATTYSGCFIKIVEVLPNTIFAIRSGNNGGANLIGDLYYIKNGSATHLDSKTIVTGGLAGFYPNIVKLKNGKVFIGYHTDTSYNVGGVVCTVENNIIVVKTPVTISTDSYGQVGLIPLSALDSNRVVISYCEKSKALPVAVVCKVNNDDSIIVGSPCSFSNVNSSGGTGQNVCAVNNNTFVAVDKKYSTNASNDGYIHICTVNDTSITISHANAAVYTVNYNSYMHPIGNNVCVLYHGRSNNQIRKTYICVENGTLLYAHNGGQIYGGSTTGYDYCGSHVRACSVGDMVDIILTNDYSSSTGRRFKYLISGKHVIHDTTAGYLVQKSPNPSYSRSGEYRDVAVLSDGSIVILFGGCSSGSVYDYTLHMIYSNEGTVSISTGSNVCGIAMESGSAGDMIDVFVTN